MKKRSIIILILLTLIFVASAIIFNHYKDLSPQYPQINFYGKDISVSVDAADQELLNGVTATDPEDGDVTDSLVVEGVSSVIKDNKIKVTYAAFDSENHVTKEERTVKFVDYKSPHFTMTAPLIFRESNNIEIVPLIGAEDVFDGDISRSVKYSIITNGIALNEAGEYEILVSVTNRIGDTSTLPLAVEITEEDPNPAMITLSDYLIYLNEGDEFDPKEYVQSYTVNKVEHTSASGLRITSEVDTDEPGVYTVDYSYNGRIESRTRLIVVVE